METYKKRVVDTILERKMRGIGAVLIEGPKWSGKTTTAKQVAKSILYMSDQETKSRNLSLAEMNPSKLLEGDTPRLIDEWQVAPVLWDTIRHEVDNRNKMGQFILTGSSVPVSTDKIFHSGAGRFAYLLMRPMSLYESLDSTGEVSLKNLFEAPKLIEGENKIDLNRLAFLVCRGGWPKATELDDDIALEHALDYYETIVRYDIARVDGVSRNVELVEKLMSSYARLQGTQANYSDIKKDIINSFPQGVTEKTVASYLNALRKMFVIEELSARNPNLRSKTAIRTSNKLYFVDPSIAVSSLGLGPQDLINDLNTFGLFFEILCIRDLRVFTDALGGKVYHYRDRNGLECDAVIHLRNGTYGLVEIKLGGETAIEQGATNLKKLRDKIDTTKMKAPSFLMVLIGVGKYAYRRKDGVYIVPIGCLKD